MAVWDPEFATRHASRNIYRQARGILDGTRSPLQALAEIVGSAEFARPPGDRPWEEAPIWPAYRHFHGVAARRTEAEERGGLSPEEHAKLEAEIVAAARELVDVPQP
jgi:hypothetical protein